MCRPRTVLLVRRRVVVVIATNTWLNKKIQQQNIQAKTENADGYDGDENRVNRLVTQFEDTCQTQKDKQHDLRDNSGQNP